MASIRIVSDRREEKSNERTCKWQSCTKSASVFNTIEDLLDHVLEEHIPTVARNDDNEEEVVCAWETCEMRTTRGDLKKKTEWMQNHFKTRHARNAKTYKCLINGCSVVKATSQEIEIHLRLSHPANPRNEKLIELARTECSPQSEFTPNKDANRIWKVVNGEVQWDPPIRVAKKTIVVYDDGPRYVYPSGCSRCNYDSDESELASDECWSLSDGSDIEMSIKTSGKQCLKECSSSKRKKRLRKRKYQEQNCHKVATKAKIGKPTSSKPPVLAVQPTYSCNAEDDAKMPLLIAHLSDVKHVKEEYLEQNANEKTGKTEKMVEVPMKRRRRLPFKGSKRPSRACKQNFSFSEIDEHIEAFEIVFDAPLKKNSTKTTEERKMKRATKKECIIQQLLSNAKKMQSFKDYKRFKRMLSPKRRPPRACRVLGSLEEVPFDVEIGVDFGAS